MPFILIREKSITTHRSFINFWGLGNDFRRIISAALPACKALMQIRISIKPKVALNSLSNIFLFLSSAEVR